MIQVQGLTKYYGKHAAIRELAFTIERGEVIGFLGEEELQVAKNGDGLAVEHQRGELRRRRLGHGSAGSQVSRANRVHHFHARKRTPGRPERLKPEHGMSNPFHCSVVLFDNIIQIFTVTHDNPSLMCPVVMSERCGIRPTLIDRDFLRQPLAANGLA